MVLGNWVWWCEAAFEDEDEEVETVGEIWRPRELVPLWIRGESWPVSLRGGRGLCSRIYGM